MFGHERNHAVQALLGVAVAILTVAEGVELVYEQDPTQTRLENALRLLSGRSQVLTDQIGATGHTEVSPRQESQGGVKPTENLRRARLPGARRAVQHRVMHRIAMAAQPLYAEEHLIDDALLQAHHPDHPVELPQNGQNLPEPGVHHAQITLLGPSDELPQALVARRKLGAFGFHFYIRAVRTHIPSRSLFPHLPGCCGPAHPRLYVIRAGCPNRMR